MVRRNKAQKVRKFLKENPKGTHKEFETLMGFTISSSYFSHIKGDLQDEGMAMARHLEAQTAAPLPHSEHVESEDSKSEPASVVLTLQVALDREREENEYLRWLIAGERNGWLDRALNELSGPEEAEIEAPRALEDVPR